MTGAAGQHDNHKRSLMRIFSIVAALTVFFIMYMFIFERPALLSTLGMLPAEVGSEEQAGATTEEADGPKAAATDLVKVMVQRSIAQEYNDAVVLRGQTAAARQVDVRAETTSTVVSDPLRKGASVQKGDPLCVLDPGTRKAGLAEAQARLSEAQSRVPEADARVTEAQARLEEAMINQNAASKLIKDGFASQTRVAATDAAVAAARAGVTSATAGLETARSGIQAARAAVASAEKEIDRLTIVAPFSGLLESDTAELGSLLQPGALCATIIQLDPVKLVAFVPETEVHRVTTGALARARLAAGGQELNGKVSFLSRSADPNTRTFRVEINVANRDLSIRDGQTAEIVVASAGIEAHLIPQSALTLNDEGTLGVRLIDDEAVVSFAPVTLLRDTVDGVWVGGLASEIDLIVLGQEYVTAGVQVAPTWRELGQ
jgi:membrane fusion protein, multidrug efflux system